MLAKLFLIAHLLQYTFSQQTLSGKSLVNHVNTIQTLWKAEYFEISEEEMKFKVMDSKFAFPEEQISSEPYNSLPGSLSRAPTSFDARDYWPNCKSIKMIRDQAYCGSCWAFGAAEVISDRICIQSNGTDQPIISPEDILTCCTNSHGCQGGFVLESMKFWKSKGVVTGGDFQGDGCIPYSYGSCSDCHTAQTTPKCKNECQVKYTKNEYKEDKYYGSSAYRLSTSNAVRTIQSEILRNGPVEATYQVYEDFYYYKSGVYEYISGRHMGGHAVKIIGWGVEENVNYWLIANSWGTGFGENGFFKMRRGNNECGIENYVVAGMVKSGRSVLNFGVFVFLLISLLWVCCE